MIAVVDETGVVVVRLPDDVDPAPHLRPGWTTRAATPADAPEPPLPMLNASQIMALFTIAEHGRARGMVDARDAQGNLIDPLRQVQVLIDRLAALGERRLPLNDTFIVQGVALFLGLNLFDGATPAERQQRAARVLAGLPPLVPPLTPPGQPA